MLFYSFIRALIKAFAFKLFSQKIQLKISWILTAIITLYYFWCVSTIHFFPIYAQVLTSTSNTSGVKG